jgi:inner membrane transporter RhtA
MVRGDRIPPTLLVLAAVASVQFGAALAKTLFDDIGPGGTVFLRLLFATIILATAWRPALGGHSRADWRLLLAFGFALAAMNLSFYEALERIPLGIAVTFEFVGPLGVAVAGSRRPLDLVWVLLAAAGILLLSDFGGADLDALGVALALLAGGFWAAYIVLAVRVGRAYEGGQGLALAMAALAGFIVLGEGLAGRELVAIVLVVAASAGAARGATVPPRDA